MINKNNKRVKWTSNSLSKKQRGLHDLPGMQFHKLFSSCFVVNWPVIMNAH